MERVLNLYKPLGETPLQTLEAFQAAHPEYAKEKMTYAGRLDPLAEGVLIALVGEETKNREAYTNLPKEYVFEWIFGLETDTYDLLGLVKEIKNSRETASSLLEKYFADSAQKFSQKYPPFSSKVVGGKSLFSLAKAGRIFEKDLPSHEVEIYESEYLGNREISKETFLKTIEEKIDSVSGDFRQKQILLDWKNRLSKSERETYVVHKARLAVSSGFYVRQFVLDIGKHFDTAAVTFSILRTKVGSYKANKSLHLR